MDPSPWHYESALVEVQTIIEQIESGELNLADIVDQFEAATKILKDCEIFLKAKQAQVDLIIEHLQDDPEISQASESEPSF